MMYTLEQLLNTFKTTNMKFMIAFKRKGERLYSNAIFMDVLTLRLIKLIYNAVKMGYEYEVYDQHGNKTSLLALDLPVSKVNDNSTPISSSHRGFM